MFASNDVCQLAGISLRQLQWWDERDVVSPRKEGHRRLYVFEDVVVIMVIAELRRKGLSLQKVRRVARLFRRDVTPRLRDALRSGSALQLVTDGKSAHFERETEAVIELLKRSRSAMFLVSVSDQLQRLIEFQRTHGIRLAHSGGDQLRLL